MARIFVHEITQATLCPLEEGRVTVDFTSKHDSIILFFPDKESARRILLLALALIDAPDKADTL